MLWSIIWILGSIHHFLSSFLLPIFLSSRPGLSRAGSRVSGRLVAMIIFTWRRGENFDELNFWQSLVTVHTWINLPGLKHQIHPFDSATKKTRKVCPTSKQILLQNTSSSMARTSKRVEYKLQRTSISVLWISLSADVPSENRRPPVWWTILDSYNWKVVFMSVGNPWYNLHDYTWSFSSKQITSNYTVCSPIASISSINMMHGSWSLA